MPLFATLGSLYETKQAPPKPAPVSNITLTRNAGYNLTATYTDATYPAPYNYPVTYYGNLASGNKYASTSNTTSMNFTKVPPFSNYAANIIASTIIGNSLSNTSANYYMTSNLSSNGNITIGNAVTLTISPNGNEVDVATLQGYLLRYSRNSTTGQLSLISNTLITSNPISSLTYSADGNFLYIYANSGSRIYNYNISNSSFNLTGLTNVSGQTTNTLSQNQLFSSLDNKYIIATGSISPTPKNIIYYYRDSNTGNLTYLQRVGVGANYTNPQNFRPYYNGTGNIVVAHSDGAGNAQVALYYQVGNSIAFSNITSLFLSSNNTSIIANATLVKNSIYLTISNTTSNQLRSFLYDTGITPQQTINVSTSGYAFCPVIPQSNNETTILLYNSNVTGQRNTDGNLTILSNSTGYSANFTSSAVISNDTKHVYTLLGNVLTIYNVLS